MNSTVEISDSIHRRAPMDARAVRILMDAGALPNDGRVELVDGELIEMSPSNDPHGAALSELIFALKSQLTRDYGVIVDAAVYLSDTLMLGPDIVVLRRPLVSHEATGPDFDLIVEISHTTLTQDLGWKAERYARHGVREYWVVDLENEKLHVHLDPGADGYGSITAQNWDSEAKPHLLPGISLTLADILAE